MGIGVREHLGEIDDQLRAKGANLAIDRLAHGLPVEVVRRKLSQQNLVSGEDVEAWWGWRDGLPEGVPEPMGQVWLLPGFYKLMLDEALEILSAGRDDERWDSTWLPLMADGGGRYLVLEAGAASGARRVRLFRNEEWEQPVAFESLGSMLSTLCVALQRGVVTVDGAGSIDMEDAEFSALAAEMNPSVAIWRRD